MSEAEAASGGWDCHVHVFDAQAPVAAGHYRPGHRPLSQIEALAASQGVHHLVLVQPSVYGSDNRLLLQALAQSPGRHRAVVVLDDAADDASLQAMHQAGVRGARLNLVSPVGERGGAGDPDLARRFAALAPRLHALGWHLQWYAAPQHLAELAAWHRQPGAPVAVLDHLAGLHAGIADGDPAWAALARLADGGAWLKLSGWYRLQASAPYTGLVPAVRRLAAMFGPRLVWGSDWPHTSFDYAAAPPYDSTWAPVVAALGEAAAQRIRQHQPEIYR